MSHLFVLERMTAHINMRGRNKFATPPLVLCSILLFHIDIISQMEERCNIFITCLCLERSERNGLKYENISEVKRVLKTHKIGVFGTLFFVITDKIKGCGDFRI